MEEKGRRASVKILLILFFAALCIVIVSIMAGTRFITPGDLVALLQGKGDPLAGAMLRELRLPRILMALITGASLAAGGTVFQAMLRNPLADPFIIGVSGGAAVGATVVIIFFQGSVPVMAGAFAGSLGATFMVFAFSRSLNPGSESLLLAGVAISFVLSSIVFLLYAFSASHDVHRAVMWMMGDLSRGDYGMIAAGGMLVILLMVLLLFFHRHLDILSFGENFSQAMGVGRGSQTAIFWLAAFMVAIPVSLAGVIGFVGLMVPHMARRVAGPEHSRLLPLSALMGAFFLLGADTAGRSVAAPYEIPVGIITGLAGGCFFFIMLVRRRR